MQKNNDQKAAAILAWLLMPLALVDLAVLLIASVQPKWYLPIALFVFLYMVPALVIWGLLMLLAYSRRSLLFARTTWGAHVVFNIGASLLWLGNAIFNRDALPMSLYPLGITLPVLIWTACLFSRTFKIQ